MSRPTHICTQINNEPRTCPLKWGDCAHAQRHYPMSQPEGKLCTEPTYCAFKSRRVKCIEPTHPLKVRAKKKPG